MMSRYLVYNEGTKERMMKMEQAICQSCGMPLSEDVLEVMPMVQKNEEYCMYCMKS